MCRANKPIEVITAAIAAVTLDVPWRGGNHSNWRQPPPRQHCSHIHWNSSKHSSSHPLLQYHRNKNKSKNITFSLFWADFFLFAYHLNILFLQFLFASLSLRLFLKQSTSFGAKWLRIRNHFTLPWAPAPTTSRVLIAGPRPRPVWCVPGCVAAPRGITAVPAGSTWAYTAVHNFRYPLKKDHRIRIIITQWTNVDQFCHLIYIQ